MSKKLALATLRDCLAGIYQDDDDARRVCVDAGLKPETINFETSSLNRWFNIIEKARQTDKFDSLIQVCIKDSGNLELKTLYQGFLDAEDVPEIDGEWSNWKKLRWLFIPLCIILLAGLVFYFYPKRITPTEIPIKEIEDAKIIEKFDVVVNPYETDALKLEKDPNFRGGVLKIESTIEKPTTEFKWILSTQDVQKLTGRSYKLEIGRFFKLTNQSHQNLDVIKDESNENFITIKVPKCEKGEKLIAFILVKRSILEEQTNKSDKTPTVHIVKSEI